MNPFLALLEADLVRSIKPLRQYALMGAATFIIFLLFGAGRDLLGSILAVFGAAALFTLPNEVLRDRMTRGLEFVLGLPVTPETIVAARFSAVALVSLPSAGLCVIAAMVADWPPMAVPLPLLFLGLWILATCGVCAWVAIIMAADLQMATMAPFALLLGLMAGSVLSERFAPGLWPAVGAWLVRAARGGALPYLFAILAGGVVAGAYAFAVRGLKRYRPDPGGEELVGAHPHALLIQKRAEGR